MARLFKEPYQKMVHKEGRFIFAALPAHNWLFVFWLKKKPLYLPDIYNLDEQLQVFQCWKEVVYPEI